MKSLLSATQFDLREFTYEMFGVENAISVDKLFPRKKVLLSGFQRKLGSLYPTIRRGARNTYRLI